MIERVRVRNIDQINKIAYVASALDSDVGIHDANGQIADAKSLLGLLRLDYTRPVEVVSENARALRKAGGGEEQEDRDQSSRVLHDGKLVDFSIIYKARGFVKRARAAACVFSPSSTVLCTPYCEHERPVPRATFAA